MIRTPYNPYNPYNQVTLSSLHSGNCGFTVFEHLFLYTFFEQALQWCVKLVVFSRKIFGRSARPRFHAKTLPSNVANFAAKSAQKQHVKIKQVVRNQALDRKTHHAEYLVSHHMYINTSSLISHLKYVFFRLFEHIRFR